MFSFSTLLVSRITYVYPAFDSLRIFRHSSGPVKSGSIQSVIMIFGRNFTIDASASFPSFANANSYGCPRKACSSSLRENGESSTTSTRIRPPGIATAGVTTAIACLSSRLISKNVAGLLRTGFYGRVTSIIAYNVRLHNHEVNLSFQNRASVARLHASRHLRVIPAPLIVFIDIRGQLWSDTTSNQP